MLTRTCWERSTKIIKFPRSRSKRTVLNTEKTQSETLPLTNINNILMLLAWKYFWKENKLRASDKTKWEFNFQSIGLTFYDE